MEHLAINSNLSLLDFCKRLSALLDLPSFEFDSENETEWGKSEKGDLIINVSRPYQKGTLQEWDDTVPEGCNFGISVIKQNIDVAEIKRFSKLIADEFKSSVYYHRTWLEPGKNIKRNIETSYNNT